MYEFCRERATGPASEKGCLAFLKKRSWLSEGLKCSYEGKKRCLHMSSMRTILSINIYCEKYTNSRDWKLIMQIKPSLSGFFLFVCFFLCLLEVFCAFLWVGCVVCFCFFFFFLVVWVFSPIWWVIMQFLWFTLMIVLVMHLLRNISLILQAHVCTISFERHHNAKASFSVLKAVDNACSTEEVRSIITRFSTIYHFIDSANSISSLSLQGMKNYRLANQYVSVLFYSSFFK